MFAALVCAACSAPPPTVAQDLPNGAELPSPSPAIAADPRAEPARPSTILAASVQAQSRDAQPRVIDFEGVLAQGGFARGRVRGGAPARVTLDEMDVPVAADGSFFVAFGRDDRMMKRLSVRYEDGTDLAQSFALADTDFPESRLPPITQKIESSPRFQARRAAELERIFAARTGRSDLDGWRQDFMRPAEGRISGVFGSQRFYGEEARSPHSGMDIAAPAGAPVIAPAAGDVVLAGGGYSFEGNLVILDHGLGLYSAFLHLTRIDVAVGDRLEQGQPLGTVGASGRATGPHLHWGLWWNGIRFDPAALTAR
ncbi:MAG: M23 family metallopeptidase [Pseudomonadota bacterium]